MKRSLFIVVVMLSMMTLLLSCSDEKLKQEDEFQNSEWGKTIEEVLNSETGFELKYIPQLNGVYGETEINGVNTNIAFKFDDNDTLYEYIHTTPLNGYNDDECIMFYKLMKEELIELHGEPEEDVIRNENGLFDVKDGISFDVTESFKQSISIYGTVWQTNDTQIFMTMGKLGNSPVELITTFSDKNHEGFEKMEFNRD